MLQVGLIGCGNAGNQVLVEAMNMCPDIKLYAVNSSDNDLATLPPEIKRTRIGDGKGSGKNRQEAKQFLSQEIIELVKNGDFKSFMADLDLVFVVSSTGGGTGSGVSLVLSQVLKQAYVNQYIIPIGICPTLKEAESTQANTLEYLTELYKVMDSDTTYMLYDNEKFADLPPHKLLPAINKAIVSDVNVLRCYYNATTKYDSIDEKDALTVIRTPKRLMVASVYDCKEKDIEEQSLEDRLKENIIKGAHVEIQKDHIVNRTGIILNVSENVLNDFNVQIPTIRSYLGDPVEEFKHLVVNMDRKLPNNAFLIISGMTSVNDRIAKIKDRIEEIQEAQKQQEDESELDSDLVAAVNGKRTYVNDDGDNKPIDIMGIFNSFGV